MRRVGPYELVQKLGAGGMAEVWMGRRVAMGGASKSVAIKLLAAHHIDKPEYRKMFMDEARLSMLLTNSNIVQVFDVGEEDGLFYMAMEWVDGCDLADLCARLREHGTRLSDEVIAYIVGEILRALRYAHELTHEGGDATIVHRDISPQNVMLSISGEVKLMDFGVARLAGSETQGQFVKGKLRYMPPEQLRGNSRDPTVDLFAVGAVLHELLDGRKFRSACADENELYAMILEGVYPPLSIPANEIPMELDQLRWGLLTARAEDRIQSARGALQRLRKWPNYGDASMELEELVRWAVGAEAPRTGLEAPTPQQLGGTVVLHQASIWGEGFEQEQGYSPQGDGWGESQATGREPVHGEGSRTDLTPRSDTTGSGVSPAYHDNSGLTPGTDPERPVSRSVPVVGAAEGEGRSLMSVLLPLGMVVIALGFGLFAAGMLFGWFDDDEPAEASKAAQAEPAEHAEPAKAPEHGEAVPEVAPSPAETGEPEAATDEGDLVVEEDVEPEPEPEPDQAEAVPVVEPKPKRQAKDDEDDGKGKKRNKDEEEDAGKGSVTLVAKHYDQVDVKLGSKVVSMKGKKTVELAPGSYQISLREGEGDWKPAGKITVEAEAAYQVQLLKPPLAMVKKL